MGSCGVRSQLHQAECIALRGTHLQTGDLVYLHQVYPSSFDRAGMDVKLWPAFGPQLFQVMEVVSPQLCRIQEFKNPIGFNDIVHNQRLKPFTPRDAAISRFISYLEWVLIFHTQSINQPLFCVLSSLLFFDRLYTYSSTQSQKHDRFTAGPADHHG